MSWFNRRKVSTRFLIISLFLLPFILLLTGAGLYGVFRIEGVVQQTRSDELPSVYDLSQVVDDINSVRTLAFRHPLNLDNNSSQTNSNQPSDFKGTIDNLLLDLKKYWQDYKTVPADDTELALDKQFDNLLTNWEQQLNTLIAQLPTTPTAGPPNTTQINSELGNLLNQISDTGDQLSVISNQLLDKSYNDAQDNAVNADNTFSEVVWVIVVSLVIVLVFFGIAGFVLGYSIVNLTNALFRSNKQTSEALESREQKRQVSEQVSHKLNTITSELSAVTVQQTARSQQQAKSVQDVTVTLNELVETSRDIANNAQNVLKAAQLSLAVAQDVSLSSKDAGESASEGLTSVANTIQIIEQAQHSIVTLNENLELLVASSSRINSVITLIKDIADQTHLLSLNAAIESAGAGLYGERFSIVAREIKQLATRAVNATNEVRLLISEVQSGITNAVDSSNLASEKVQEAVEQSYSTNQIIAGLGQVVVATVGKATSIVQATERVAIVATEISLSTQQQESAIKNVSVTMEEIATVVQENATATSQVSITVGDINDLSGRLTENLMISVAKEQGTLLNTKILQLA